MDNKLLMSAAVGGVIGSVATLGIYCLMKHSGEKRSQIKRIGTEDPRASKVVIYDGKLHMSGQVGEIDKLGESNITEQTKQTLAKIDDFLNQAGIGRDRILEARIWLKNIDTDFKEMNAVWNAWVDPNNKGTRYCVGANLARPTILVEIQVTAAL